MADKRALIICRTVIRCPIMAAVDGLLMRRHDARVTRPAFYAMMACYVAAFQGWLNHSAPRHMSGARAAGQHGGHTPNDRRLACEGA
jgi:hypothetical protein